MSNTVLYAHPAHLHQVIHLQPTSTTVIEHLNLVEHHIVRRPCERSRSQGESVVRVEQRRLCFDSDTHKRIVLLLGDRVECECELGPAS